MQNTALISAKLEDYLTAVLELESRNRVARVSDIAAEMGVQMPTVTGALKHLAEHGLVNYEPYQFVTLTGQGRELAESLVRAHEVLQQFLLGVLGVPADVAERDACGMEHAVSSETLERLIQFVGYVQAKRNLVAQFQKSAEAGDGTS